MADLSTNYLGIKLKNPIIAASSGLTGEIKKIAKLEEDGVAAIVLKSLFEEEITHEYEALINEAENIGYSTENLDYFDVHIKEKNLNNYLSLIKEAKANVSIPIIASINCHSNHEWEYFAKEIENAGADALELNIAISPADIDLNSKDIEKQHLNIIKKIRKKISIPIAVKMSPYFSNLAHIISTFAKTGIDGLVLFNRFYCPDIDIHKLEVKSSFIHSHSTDYIQSLRWIGIMSRRIDIDLAASTGIHDSETLIKQILAGASAVQLASVFYNEGSEVTRDLLKTLEHWMDEKGFINLNQFRGLVSQVSSSDPAAYERIQFMKYFSGKF
jgi:dihydroorotate dehydrogenase (fumarate)